MGPNGCTFAQSNVVGACWSGLHIDAAVGQLAADDFHVTDELLTRPSPRTSTPKAPAGRRRNVFRHRIRPQRAGPSLTGPRSLLLAVTNT